MDGQILQGIGSLCMGVAALAGSIWTISRAGSILEVLRDRAAVIAERDHWKDIASRNAERADSAERSAQNLERAADGAEQYARDLEKRISAIETRIATFDQLVFYTRSLLEWAMRAETTSRTGGVILPPVPGVPRDLAIALAQT